MEDKDLTRLTINLQERIIDIHEVFTANLQEDDSSNIMLNALTSIIAKLVASYEMLGADKKQLLKQVSTLTESKTEAWVKIMRGENVKS